MTTPRAGSKSGSEASQFNAYLGVGLNLALALFFAIPPKNLRRQLDACAVRDRERTPVAAGTS